MRKLTLSLLLLFFFSLTTWSKQVVGVVAIDTKQLPEAASKQLMHIARLELVNLDSFEVLDSYDIEYLVKAKNENLLTNCYAKACIVEVGKLVQAEKLMSGSVLLIDGFIIVNLKWINVPMASVEKEITQKYYYQYENLPSIISFSIRQLLNLPVDSTLLNNLIYTHPKEVVAGPKIETINLTGPRLGFTAFTGATAEILNAPVSEGGFNASPYMFQFGYQFETRYLNEGKYQALFEFIPMITGFDQGHFMPSFTILNGLRNNKSGFEFGIGPSFGLINRAKGYYDEQGKWQIADDSITVPYPIVKRIDSRGELEFFSSCVITVGKTIRSGKLNIPVNAYFIPSKGGGRFGISFGFNSSKRRS